MLSIFLLFTDSDYLPLVSSNSSYNNTMMKNVKIITSAKLILFNIIPWKLWPSWPWSYGSWIYNYLCNQRLSPLMLLVQISIRARCPTLCDNVCQCLATGRWFSLGTPVSSTNETYHHDIAEILLKVALNTIKQTINKNQNKYQ
jgi:hypothetical protein